MLIGLGGKLKDEKTVICLLITAVFLRGRKFIPVGCELYVGLIIFDN